MNAKIVVIGCGFGGVALAKALKNKNYEVLLLDKNNYHTFQPLLYQIATGGLEPESIAYPIRRIIRNYKNIRFQMTEVISCDFKNKELTTSIGSIKYDYLVIANGSGVNFLDFKAIKNQLFPLKSVSDALNIRSYIMQNFEKANATQNSTEKKELFNIAIIGGGPTGIELAGSLAEMKKFVLPKDYPDLDFTKMSIILFEAAPKLLTSMSKEASVQSAKYLREMGVKVKLNSPVKTIDDHKVYLENGAEFLTNTAIWTAGVQGNFIDGFPAKDIVSGKRLKVDEFNVATGLKDVYAVGDVAACVTESHPKGLPLLAAVAIQQARHLAQNFVYLSEGKMMKPFIYKNKGVMATVGRNKAVADFPTIKFHGHFAWFIWSFVHLFSLVGFRNKVITFTDWFINYINYDQPLGIIIRSFHKKKKAGKKIYYQEEKI